jgi:hypothetical protein
LGIAFTIIFVRLNSLTTSAEKKTKTLISTFLFIQILVVCHYLPLTSIPFGLILTGFASFLINLCLLSDPKENLLTAVRNAALYAIPFLVGAFFFL